MSTTVISAASLESAWVRRPTVVDRWTSSELVKAFGSRVFSIAKHITHNDNDAEDVLIAAFLEVCSHLDRRQEDENVWLRLVTIAVREAFSRLRNRGEGRRILDRAADSCEDVVVRELSVWGENDQQHYSSEKTACVLVQGMRSLNPMCRTVFLLRDIEEISAGHVAKIVNRSAAAVEICLLRARLQLREFLAGQMRLQQ